MTGLPDGVSPFPPLPDGASLRELHQRLTELEHLVAVLGGVRGQGIDPDEEISHAAEAREEWLVGALQQRGWTLRTHQVPVGYDGEERITIRRLEHVSDPRSGKPGPAAGGEVDG